MKVSVNYHEILEENLIEEIEWLKEEFIILFKSKVPKYTTERDKNTANNILDYMMDNVYVYDSMILLTLFTEAIENIERMYPNLF